MRADRRRRRGGCARRPAATWTCAAARPSSSPFEDRTRFTVPTSGHPGDGPAAHGHDDVARAETHWGSAGVAFSRGPGPGVPDQCLGSGGPVRDARLREGLRGAYGGDLGIVQTSSVRSSSSSSAVMRASMSASGHGGRPVVRPVVSVPLSPGHSRRGPVVAGISPWLGAAWLWSTPCRTSERAEAQLGVLRYNRRDAVELGWLERVETSMDPVRSRSSSPSRAASRMADRSPDGHAPHRSRRGAHEGRHPAAPPTQRPLPDQAEALASFARCFGTVSAFGSAPRGHSPDDRTAVRWVQPRWRRRRGRHGQGGDLTAAPDGQTGDHRHAATVSGERGRWRDRSSAVPARMAGRWLWTTRRSRCGRLGARTIAASPS